jgi:hypothetical protein
MKERDENLVAMRPAVIFEDVAVALVEQFQNNTLRPILKLQNDLILSLFKVHIARLKMSPNGRDAAAKHQLVLAAFKNIALRSELLGLVIGHFTQAEFAHFLIDQEAVRKRIYILMQQRIVSQI